MTQIKYCKSCNRQLSMTCFYQNKTRKGGLSWQCKDCYSQKHRDRRLRIIQNNIVLGDKLYTKIQKKCGTCKFTKPISDFYKASDTIDGLNQICKSCNKIACQKYQNSHKKTVAINKAQYAQRNKIKIAAYMAVYGKNYRYQTKYGITVQERNQMLEWQDGKCAICGKDESNKQLAVDHCHKQGHVRMLLCDDCNLMLGLIEDNIQTLSAAAEYLKCYQHAIDNNAEV